MDVISSHEIERGELKQYRILVVPTNDCYFALEHEKMEEEIRSWVAQGGIVLHGPQDQLAENCFGIQGEVCEKTPYRYGKVIIAQGERFCRYEGGKEIAPYVDQMGRCVAEYAGEELAQRMNLSTGTPHFSGENTGSGVFLRRTDRSLLCGKKYTSCSL